jgi:hypothetical protein
MHPAKVTVDPSWYNAPPLLQIAASQQGGARGAQLWGVTKDYTLISIYQETPGGSWSGWSTGNWLNAPPQVVQITAAQRSDGCVQFWATDQKQQLWSIVQTSPGGDWSSWSGPNWNAAPILTEIGAVELGGSLSAQLWGVTTSNQLISAFQETPRAAWSSWSTGSWLNAPPVIGVTAAGAERRAGADLGARHQAAAVERMADLARRQLDAVGAVAHRTGDAGAGKKRAARRRPFSF